MSQRRIRSGTNVIGPAIRSYREQHGLTCTELSYELEKVGYTVSPRRIELLENQSCVAYDSDIYYFAKALHLPDAALLFSK